MMKRPNYLQTIILVLFALILSACNTPVFKPNPGHPAASQINKELSMDVADNTKILNKGSASVPNSVQAALLPSLAVSKPSETPLERFDINVTNMPAQAFFMGLVKDTPYNIVVGPQVTGNITLDLKKVTIPDVLEAVRDTYGYQYTIENYGVHITTSGMQTRTFRVNYIDMQRSGQSRTSISSGQLTQSGRTTSTSTSGATTTSRSSSSDDDSDAGSASASYVDTKVHSDFWDSLKTNLQAIVGNEEGSKVLVNAQAGLVVVRALPSTLREVAHYLDVIQSIMNREVIIEAKVLSIDLSKGYQAGVDWKALGASQTANQDLTDNNELRTFANIFTLNMHSSSGDFSLILHLLASQGNVQVLSSPRVSTMNNQKALIKVGDDEYFVTDVSSTTLSSSSNETTQDVDLTPFFSGIALDVTPEISGQNSVILHIHPIVSRVTDNELKYTINGEEQKIPSALSEIKESDSIVRAQSGQVVVIGGLMENRTSEYLGSTPFLSNIPFFGSLFRRTNQLSDKTELVILLRPIVVNNATWAPELESTAKQFKEMTEGYHFGSQINRFGNLGEYQSTM